MTSNDAAVTLTLSADALEFHYDDFAESDSEEFDPGEPIVLINHDECIHIVGTPGEIQRLACNMLAEVTAYRAERERRVV
jgi:hypothetical protein